jgi:hypothetical protein
MFNEETDLFTPCSQTELSRHMASVFTMGIENEDSLIYLNELRAIQCLYQQHGWPNNFDLSAFLEALSQFKQAEKVVQDKIDGLNANRFKRSYHSSPRTTEGWNARREMVVFMQKAAGPSAIHLSGMDLRWHNINIPDFPFITAD